MLFHFNFDVEPSREQTELVENFLDSPLPMSAPTNKQRQMKFKIRFKNC